MLPLKDKKHKTTSKFHHNCVHFLETDLKNSDKHVSWIYKIPLYYIKDSALNKTPGARMI